MQKGGGARMGLNYIVISETCAEVAVLSPGLEPVSKTRLFISQAAYNV
jgi:hypothetical protein